MISKKKAFFVTGICVLITFFISVSGTISLMGSNFIANGQDDDYKKFKQVLELKRTIERDFYQEISEEALIEGMKKGVFEGLEDPYSQYYNADEYQSLMESTDGSYVGVGIVISPGEDGLITVVAPIEDTPAEKAGIEPGDKILSVDGEKFKAKEMDKAVRKIKGVPGKKVVLTVFRDNDVFDIEIVREKIQIKSVKSEMMEDIAYIRISNFDKHTGEEFNEHLSKVKKNSPKGLIIDLRDNPGGLLDQVKVVADSILGEEVIVYTMDRSGQKRYLTSDAKGKLEIPLVVLVNENSASASEILAGAVRDNKAGTLVGTTTFGKGLVQSVVGLRDNTGYTLTTAQYFTPSGEYIHKKGIKPDVVVELPKEEKEKGNSEGSKSDKKDENKEGKIDDIQLKKAVEIINDKQ
ncbi:MAG: S41 family peptidase [Peptostreptococcaceae bacterium]|nr:S41 family peptidase [Peptostreptococcaceae bacterium]